MRKKSLQRFSIMMLMVFCSSLCVTGVSFSENPTYTDPTGDQGAYPALIDMINIWIDNNATHIRFKIEFAATWDEPGWAVYIYISTGETPFDLIGGEENVTRNYELLFYADVQDFDFYAANNSNSLNDVVSLGMGYYFFSNNNQTLEIGYKLKTYSSGKGYLDLSPGQTIEVRIKSGGDTDIAPDTEKNLISYTLAGGGIDPILILLIILFPVIGVALGVFIYYRRKDTL